MKPDTRPEAHTRTARVNARRARSLRRRAERLLYEIEAWRAETAATKPPLGDA